MTSFILAIGGIVSFITIMGGLYLSFRDEQYRSKLPITLALIITALYWLGVLLVEASR